MKKQTNSSFVEHKTNAKKAGAEPLFIDKTRVTSQTTESAPASHNKSLIIKGTKQEVEEIIRGLKDRFGDITIVQLCDYYGKEALVLQ